MCFDIVCCAGRDSDAHTMTDSMLLPHTATGGRTDFRVNCLFEDVSLTPPDSAETCVVSYAWWKQVRAPRTYVKCKHLVSSVCTTHTVRAPAALLPRYCSRVPLMHNVSSWCRRSTWSSSARRGTRAATTSSRATTASRSCAVSREADCDSPS